MLDIYQLSEVSAIFSAILAAESHEMSLSPGTTTTQFVE
jgi:hypothetical protein